MAREVSLFKFGRRYGDESETAADEQLQPLGSLKVRVFAGLLLLVIGVARAQTASAPASDWRRKLGVGREADGWVSVPRDPKSLEYRALVSSMCARTLCQHDVRIFLKKNDGSVYDETIDVLPDPIQPFGVVVMAGQTIHVEFDLEGSVLVHPRSVFAVTSPAKTITATFQQMDDHGMMFSIHNPFDRSVKFGMAIMALGANGLEETSSCPVRAHGTSYERWGYPILQLVFGNGRVLPSEDKVLCD